MLGSRTSSGDALGHGNSTVKFLCSYGGRILPRHTDGRLRYVGGETRVLSVHRSLSFDELAVKLGEMCGEPSVIVRCQLPTDDLDALISVSSDEDVRNLIEEYDRYNQGKAAPLKIRTFLWPRRVKSPPSPPPSLRFADAGMAKKPAGKMFVPIDACGCRVHRIVFPARISGHQQHYYHRPDDRLIVAVDGSAGSPLKTMQPALRACG